MMLACRRIACCVGKWSAAVSRGFTSFPQSSAPTSSGSDNNDAEKRQDEPTVAVEATIKASTGAASRLSGPEQKLNSERLDAGLKVKPSTRCMKDGDGAAAGQASSDSHAPQRAFPRDASDNPSFTGYSLLTKPTVRNLEAVPGVYQVFSMASNGQMEFLYMGATGNLQKHMQKYLFPSTVYGQKLQHLRTVPYMRYSKCASKQEALEIKKEIREQVMSN